MSLNIDMKMILLVKFSGSHKISTGESWENLPFEFHRLSINSIQFPEVIVARIPLNLFLPGFNKIVSHLSQTEYRIGRRRRLWQWNIDKFDCATSLSTSTPNLGHQSSSCQQFLSDHWPAFLFPWKNVPLFFKDDSLQILNIRDESLFEEWYSWALSK